MNNNLVLLLIVVVASGILAALGIWEKRKNEKCLKQLKIRVNVNGIRGKSTATRMITAILKEAGYQVIGKTTGTAARMIYWDSSEETEIKRRPRGVSISEQIRVIRQATKYGADALVCECMAVRPEYQKVYQHDIIKANVTVIVNVREDHLDEMGPTLEQLAWAFGETIPYNGIAVIPRGEFEDYFKEIARKRSTKAVVVDETQMPTRLLQAYDYKVFPNNCAVAIYTAMALNIPMDQIVAGVLKAQPDPGALRIIPIRGKRLETWFVNAFAANEPDSTLEIWDSLMLERIPMDNPIVVMNCRPDRVDRTAQFAFDCLPYMGPITLVVIGEKTHPIRKAYKRGKLANVRAYYNLENASLEKIMETLRPMLNRRTVVGIGNIHGIGEPFIEGMLSLGEVGCYHDYAVAADETT
ncbi:MAG: poly-gamma-glutamate synthase PgsB [Oscillospiraceae bacterium]|nr:poly-gamma-glutamate synthase PgsB [Oscillospiraceae bacterium]